MTVIIRPSGGRWAGVDYVGGSTRTLDTAVELAMVNGGFASWAAGSGEDRLVPAQVRVPPAGSAAVEDPQNPGGALGGPGSVAVQSLTASRALTSSDNGATLVYSGSADIVLTVPQGLSSGFSATAVQQGGGRVSFLQGAGVGFDNIGSTRGSGTFATIMQVSADQYGFQNPVPSCPVTLISGAIPFILISAWTFGANGALTSGATLNRAYSNAYVYFPADAIGAGVPAGWYYTVFSSTTAGTVYNNRYLGGKVATPASPTAFVASGGTVVAQDTSVIQGPSVTLPGGSMGINGRLCTELVATGNSTAANKVASARLATSDVTTVTLTSSVTTQERGNVLQNMGELARQLSRTTGLDSGTGAVSFPPVDTTIDQTVSFALRLQTAAAADYIVLQRYCATVEFGGA